MKNILILVLTFLIFGCSKSGKKALSEGDYFTATLQAVEKLRRDGDNNKSSEVLQNAYRLASEDLLRDIERAKLANQQFKYDRVVDGFAKLNQMHQEIEDCPSCRRLVSPKSFFQQENDAIDIAANERYEYGLQQLKGNTMEAGRLAFESFDRMYQYAPNFKKVVELREEALNMGSVHVLIEQPKLNSRLYDYSYDYFQSQIEDYLTNNQRISQFIRFYAPQEAEQLKLSPDQVVRLEFVEFVVGQTRVDSKERKVTSEDSVKTGTAKLRGKDVDVYGKVNATITENRKQVLSRGVMLMEVYDVESKKVLHTRELAGEFNWFNEWLTFNGDDRALSEEQLKLSKNKEELPPPTQQLFIEFCRPIYSQFTSELERFYRNY